MASSPPLLLLHVCVLATLVLSAAAFWSGDDSKYIKKFAMMKVYESCFGDEVVQEVREEMRQAAARCAAAAASDPAVPAPSGFHPLATARPPAHAAPPGVTETPILRPLRPVEPAKKPSPVASSQTLNTESMLRLQLLLQGLRASGANLAASSVNSPASQPPQPPQHAPPQPQFPRPGAYPGHHPYPEMSPYPMHHPPAAPAYPAPFYYPPMPHPAAGFYPPYNPYNPYMRSSRDIRGGAAMGGRVRNVTCVMQELGYLDSNLEPNYEGIKSRIQRLPLPVELKSDMEDAVTFCQKFSQCVPEPDPEKPQVSSEFSKPMIFFRCYKQKKLEACVLKDVRERFMSHAAAAGNSADDPELPDHNGLADDEDEHETAAAPTGSLRFRGRSGRVLPSRRSNKTPARRTVGVAADLADLVLSEDSLAL